MVTYEVECFNCGRPILQEHTQPLEDLGELHAYCSPKCSEEAFTNMVKPMVDQGAAKLVKVDCGCLVLITALGIDQQFGMPWINCRNTGDEPPPFPTHSLEIMKKAGDKLRKEYDAKHKSEQHHSE